MKPMITMHMMTSIDGRIVVTNWPKDFDLGDAYEKVHRELQGDSWLVGPVTMAEFSQGEPVQVATQESYPRETWRAPDAGKGPYAIYLDRTGKVHLNVGEVNGDPVVAVLTKSVGDNHLAALRRDGVSYIFAGDQQLDLQLAVEVLAEEFNIKSLLLEGGGGVNGAFLDAGLIDHVSLLVMPFADGEAGMPTLFDRPSAPAVKLKLLSVKQLEHEIVHLMYAIK